MCKSQLLEITEMKAADRISLGTIQVVQDVLHTKSMTLSARRMGMSQPAITQHVQKFEKLIGSKLFVRNGNTYSTVDHQLVDIVNELTELIGRLGGVSSKQYLRKPKLAIPSDLIATLNQVPYSALKLASSFCLTFGNFRQLFLDPTGIDFVFRPLYEKEPSVQFTCEKLYRWKWPVGWSSSGVVPQVIPVILPTNNCPIGKYSEDALFKSGRKYTDALRIDDTVLRSSAVDSEMGCALLPSEMVPKLPLKVPQGLDFLAKNIPLQFGLLKVGDNSDVDYAALESAHEILTVALASKNLNVVE